MKYLIVKYHELALKGNNRPWFVRKLENNLARLTSDVGVEKVSKGQMMLELTLADDADVQAIKERVKNCLGVAKFFLAHKVSTDLDGVKELLREELPQRQFGSFRISARRAEKRFPLTSEEINRELGAFVQQRTSAAVDLRSPDLEVRVDVLPREFLVYFDEVQGYGGLPVGSSGKVMGLLSGGIDSPVASWMMMKRGCDVAFTHFHSHPMVDTSSIEKAVELAETLARFQRKSVLLLVPFIEAQQRIIVTAPPPYRVVLYRRFMVRIAEALARQHRAKALATGESIGQVSSQTLENIATIDEAGTLPVLRPLVGMNKQEITAIARDIGTYSTSILPDQDCCSLFTPRHPRTRTRASIVRKLEEALPVERMVEDALERVEVRQYVFPPSREAAAPTA